VTRLCRTHKRRFPIKHFYKHGRQYQCRDSRRASWARYERTAKGASRQAVYDRTEKGRVRQAIYNLTESGAARCSVYRLTEKGRATRAITRMRARANKG
jgi:DNA-binding PadR family transcriptional regulator